MLPIELVHLTLQLTDDVSVAAAIGATCKRLHEHYLRIFVDKIDLTQLKYDRLKQLLNILTEEQLAGTKKDVLNGVYNDFLNKYVPKRDEWMVIKLDFWDLDNHWIIEGITKATYEQARQSVELIDYAREVNMNKITLRCVFDLVWAAMPNRDPDVLIEKRICDYIEFIRG